MRCSNLSKQKSALRILMRNVFIFHSMGCTSQVTYLKWRIHTLCVCLTPIVTTWFETVVSLLLPTWILLKFRKPTSWFCFLSPPGIYLSREKNILGALNNRLAELRIGGWAYLFLFNYFRNISECLYKLTLLLSKSNSALENHLIPSALG